MKILCLIFLLSFALQCSSTGSVVVPIDRELVQSVVNDPTIPHEIKTRILSRFNEVNTQAIEVIGKRNQDLQKQLESLKEIIEKDKWKVDIVNAAIKFFWIAIFMFLLYIGFRFRRIFGF